VVLYHSSGQMCVINSKAAELAGINKQSANGIERNQAGKFIGILRNEATNLVWNIIPQPDKQEMFESSMLALEQIAQAGLTSIIGYHFAQMNQSNPCIRPEKQASYPN